jgi:hypothetical protein
MIEDLAYCQPHAIDSNAPHDVDFDGLVFALYAV